VENHKGDAAHIDKVCGFLSPLIEENPPPLFIGEVSFIVEDDGSLTRYDACYDSSG
jgi:hypothetical protein